jgi:hypothetical protein
MQADKTEPVCCGRNELASPPAIFASADSKELTGALSVSADSKGVVGAVVRAKPGKKRCSSASADSKELREKTATNKERTAKRSWRHPAFFAKSAEVCDRKGDALRSGNKKSVQADENKGRLLFRQRSREAGRGGVGGVGAPKDRPRPNMRHASTKRALCLLCRTLLC